MKVLIFGGFLGSGKTTALMQLAHFIVNNSDSDSVNKVMILENEIGEIGIDDAFLRGGGFRVDNLFAGCACCTISGELVTAAIRINKEYSPDWLVVETTGVAYPRKIQDNLKNAVNIDSRISVLVDAARWKRLFIPMQGLLRSQIEGSDSVLINKADLVDSEVLDLVERDVRAFDANTTLHKISAINPIEDSIWRNVLGI